MRRAKRLSERFIEDVGGTLKNRNNILFYVDTDYEEELFELLSNNSKIREKFQRCLYLILTGQATMDVYRKEAVSSKAKDVWAIKVSSYRLYCKEVQESDKKYVVIAKHITKNTQKLSKKMKKKIKIIGGYDYEFED